MTDPCIDVTEEPCVCPYCGQLLQPEGAMQDLDGEAMECVCAGCGARCVATLVDGRTHCNWSKKK